MPENTPEKNEISGPKIPLAVYVLGLFIFLAAIASIFSGPYQNGLFIFIIVCFSLVALTMNYKNDGTERNAWDVWFFAMPGVIITLLFVGVFGESSFPEIWKWVALALGAAVGLESVSSFLKALKN